MGLVIYLFDLPAPLLKRGLPEAERIGSDSKKHSALVFRPGEGKRELARDVRRQIAHAAGADHFQHRDPLYHVTESFHQTFDAVGRARVPKETAKTGDDGQERRWQRADSEPAPVPEDASARSFSEAGGDRNMLRRFSEIAFQRGILSGAVLRGTGKMMLFSCLKKTASQSRPVNEHRRKLFDRNDLKRVVKDRSTDTVIFDPGFTHSAVGLVVDALQSARRVVEDMQALITAGRDEGRNGGDILWTMYPFLDDSRERRLLEQYHDMLGVLEGPETDERALLQSAIVRTRALIEKKTQMKEEFINKLRFISERAAKALEEFTDPAFVHELLSEATDQETPSDSAKDEKNDVAGDPGGMEEPAETSDKLSENRNGPSETPPETPEELSGSPKGSADPPEGPLGSGASGPAFFVPIIYDGDEDDEEEPGEEGEAEDGATDPEPGSADTATTDRLADA